MRVYGDELISLDVKGTAKIWSLTDYVCKATHETNICDALKMVVYLDKLIAVIRKSEIDKTVVVFSLKSGEQVLCWEEFTGNLRDMKISGNRLYAATACGACAFSLDDFQKCKEWTGHDGWVDSIDISGNLLATASSDHTVKLWDMDIGECLKTFSGHSNGVKKVTFFERSLVSCADEIKIWSFGNTAVENRRHEASGRRERPCFRGIISVFRLAGWDG